MQLRSIRPENVIRVEYYDIPPARWATRAEVVVNITTRNTESGYVYGVDLISALDTGYIDTSAYAGYTKGYNDFGLEYTLHLRDYDSKISRNKYEYPLQGLSYSSDEKIKTHTGYANQPFTLRYARALPDDYTFQVKTNFMLYNDFEKNNGLSDFIQGNTKTLDASLHRSSTDYINPSIDVYFSKNLGKKDDLSVNLVGTLYNTQIYQLDKEWVTDTDEAIFNNEMHLKARQNGFISEVAHTHNFGSTNLSSGYRISTNSVANTLENLEGYSQYTVDYREQYVYSELSGKNKKFMYRLGLGLLNIHNKSAENTVNQWSITPKLILSYPINHRQNIRFTSKYIPVSPSSDALSSNVIQLVPHIVKRGNPYLKPEQTWSNNLIYSLNNKYLDVNLKLSYTYKNKAINQLFVADPTGGYVLTYENARNYHQYALELAGSVKPFGNDYLTIKINIKPASESIKTGSGIVFRNKYIQNFFIISSTYKAFGIDYYLNFPAFSLTNSFLDKDENANHVVVKYRYKHWTFSGGIYYIGSPSKYATKSLAGSLLNYNAEVHIDNNKSMWVVGLSYDFAKGKKLEVKKKLDNQTAPAATF
ncbi:outer membrane beta-barrel protein [Elizabethkingia argentiflava]|uniref:Outer membrane beta-barrel protein n=2 Tax=Elizabethkingia argenteiflava TaxID=2681556 RepID=A0A845PSA5_9FLAO|nr:outer membrane beta-barrel protein [Elizabethkingia argenteiflava]